ncbi:MAG: tyrosine-type recombinase/integrase, partial [Pseudomonadota bacterium]
RAQTWIDAHKMTLPRWKYLSFSRSMSMIDDVVRNGIVTTAQFSYENRAVKYRVPECHSHLLAAYLQERKQEGKQSSTLQMDFSAGLRFLLFLESQGITNIESISPKTIKDYHAQAQHRTAEGKNAYIYRIRSFVRFLARKKLVPDTLELAFTTEKASRASIITILSKEQVATIRIYGMKSVSPTELRNAAMAMLALRMGFRSSDICNLCFSDILWRNRTVSIIQQKTGTPLILPLPTEAGNLVARYILEARPECALPNIFVTLKHPYTKLSTRCYASTLAIFGKKAGPEDIRGLHVVRRTFASNLLAMGNPVSLIATALGHRDEGTVDEYLATDEHKMRQCAIGLAGIEILEAIR